MKAGEALVGMKRRGSQLQSYVKLTQCHTNVYLAGEGQASGCLPSQAEHAGLLSSVFVSRAASELGSKQHLARTQEVGLQQCTYTKWGAVKLAREESKSW
jgi:hypothetical protein